MTPYTAHPPMPIRFAVSDILRMIRIWPRRARSRRALARLDARMLADIGLTEDMRRDECAKRFWEV